jgi:hypothetical protein
MAHPWLLALALLVGVGASGCGGEPSQPLPRWQLAVASEAPRDVVLPARLPLPAREAEYVLRTEAPLPEAMRGRPASLVVAATFARATLRVDGQPALPCAPARIDRYRSGGSQCWHFVAGPAETAQLELRAESTTPLSGLFDTAPELVAAPDGGAAFQRVVRFDDATEIGAAFVAGLLGVFYLAAFLFDRTRRVHLFFALQAFGGLFYPLWWLGVLQPLFGVADRCVLVESMLGAGLASLHFTHAQLGLGPVPRVWRWLVGAGAVTGLAQIAAFPPPVVPVVTAAFIAAPTITVVVLCGRAVARGKARTTAAVIGLTWLAIVLAAPFDVPALIGSPSHEGGLRVMSLAMALVGLGQGALLARQHVTSLRDADALNAELRRQVADRSRELAETLAQLGPPREQGLAAGEVVGARYRVVRRLGSGGMGEVYEVERLADGKRLALKTVLGHATRDQLSRLAREGQIAARIDHPNLVAVTDVDVSTEHGLFIVMELVDGGTLADQQARYGDTPWALDVLRQVSDGLVALHAAGVVHRDLKPANVLLARVGGVAKISDFGIASLAETRVSALAMTLDVETRTRPAAGMSRAGAIFGTPRYMAPEMATTTKHASPAADVFAFGIVASEVLGLGYPFSAPPVVDAIYGRSVRRTAVLADARLLPERVATLLEACLELDPAKRPTATEVRLGLE